MHFLKEHRKNLKKLTKKQLIQQIINHLEIDAELNMEYDKLDKEKQICEAELIRTENELKETQEALRRSRKLFEGSKELVDRQLLLIKRLERGITNTWFISDWCEGITEVLPGGVEEDMIEYKLIDKDHGKYALLLK